jgi:bleomycin hydrolase
MGKRLVIVFSVLVLSGWHAYAQSIEQKLRAFITSMPRPQRVEDFSAIPHLSPLNQDTTMFCWSFATSSFIESEMQRLGLEPVRLSIFYPVYHAYLEKAKQYVRTKGQSRFSAGDHFSGVLDIIKEYGAVPAEFYGGDKATVSDTHETLYRELDQYIAAVKRSADWHEARVVKRVQTILNKHLGKPPQ